ncbi:MAG: DNA cytosine methyltransferase [Methylobacter sp.]
MEEASTQIAWHQDCHQIGAIYKHQEYASPNLPFLLSLFCGAGGLDLGFKNEGFDIRLAIDSSAAAIHTYHRNFGTSHAICANLKELGSQGVAKALLDRLPEGSRIGVIGGPPCQGFSRANNSSYSGDPRNQLPSLYVDIVRELLVYFNVEFIVFENVLGIRDKKHACTYAALIKGIDDLDFIPDEHELCALDFGVPQNRRRVIVTAMRKNKGYGQVLPSKQKGPASVYEAIGELPPPLFFRRNLNAAEFPVHPNHWTMKPKSHRFLNPSKLKPDSRSFKRLDWNRPSPTIAFGNREIHVHPDGTRRLSIYEAMLLQGFPHEFVLQGNLSEQVEQVSNAVPPPLARSLAAAVKRSLMAK